MLLDGSPGEELGSANWPSEPATLDNLAKVHRGYIEAGCDVIRTLTSGLPQRGLSHTPGSGHRLSGRWVDLARASLEVARDATRSSSAVVAFTLGSQVDGPDGDELRHALSRLVEQTPPDLVLVQTITIVRPSFLEAIDALVRLDLPLWLSFRRCAQGLCGPSGHHWPDAGRDTFGRAAMDLERRGVAALLVNCVPSDHVEGTIEYLRYFTDLPLGVYANAWPEAGPPGTTGDGDTYVTHAVSWRAEGAQIIGGCCGVDAAMLDQVRHRLRTPTVSDEHNGAGADSTPWTAFRPPAHAVATARTEPWRTVRGRPLFPLPMPRLPGGAQLPPARSGELLLWEHLYKQGIGANQRCLQTGSTSGLLGAQLALNGAIHVHAVEADREAVDAILKTAFLNDLSAVLTAEVGELSSWAPSERFEIIVASLEQTGDDPSAPDPYGYDFDPWGRRRLDALIARLPALLAREGVAYLTQSSLLSRRRTAELLATAGLGASVVDWHLCPTTDAPERKARIEELANRSDAFSLRAPHQELVVDYLLEVRRANVESS